MNLPPGAEKPRKIMPNKKNQRVLKRVQFPDQQTDKAKRYILELQNLIEKKSDEISKCKTALGRNDPKDGSSALAELNNLQAAFERVNNMAKERLEPVIAQLNKTKSHYEAKVFKMEMFKKASKERDHSLDIIQDRIDHITAELDAPNILPVDYTPIHAVLQQTQKKQCEIEEIYRSKQFSLFNERSFSLINENLAKKLNLQQEAEKHSSRKAQSLRMEHEARINQPEQVIDEEWILARHKLDKLRLMLEDAKRSVKYLNDTAEQLANSNRRVADDLARSQDELAYFSKFLPGANHDELKNKTDGVSRYDLTVLEAQTNSADILLNVGKMKTKSIKSSLDSLKNKLAELPELVKKATESAEQTKYELENSENTLKQSQELKAELYSRKVFAEEEEKLLKERIIQQQNELESIQRQTEEAKNQIEKQRAIMQMNEEMQNLKTMNFDKFTSTISNLMKMKKQL